jgi:hypothetical protein
MSIVGKTSVAPCGHTGEVIIGTYVKCSQGCEGPAVVPRRGEIGHVENCACKPCQIRRKVTTILLRDKNGKDWLKFEWDGVTNELVTQTTKSGHIRHYQFLDADGKIIVRGDTNAWIEPGGVRINIKMLMDDAVKCVVSKGAIYQKFSDLVTVTITVNKAPPVPTVGGVWTLPPGYFVTP